MPLHCKALVWGEPLSSLFPEPALAALTCRPAGPAPAGRGSGAASCGSAVPCPRDGAAPGP